MKQEVININDFRQLVPFFNTPFGYRVLKFLFSITGIRKVNRAYRNSCPYEGTEFTTRLLKELGATYHINNGEELEKLPEGTFITVSNHPYGGLDGIILIHMIAAHRKDFKVMVNWILGYVEAMSKHFICVDPTPATVNGRNINGFKQTMGHIRDGHPMGFFPAGAVSDYNARLRVEDREWQPTVLRLIKSSHCPVIPVYFHNHNSVFFHSLGLVHWKLRMLRLPRELFNKKGKTIEITIGQPITVEEQDKYEDIGEFGKFLKNETYKLNKKQ